MDLSIKKDFGSSDPGNHEALDSISSPDSSSKSNQLKACTDCKTTKTPLWRVGPHGPKSLCNACGIKYRKKKRDVKVKEINMKAIGLKKKCNLGEEEQAAIVLMNLSSGLIYT